MYYRRIIKRLLEFCYQSSIRGIVAINLFTPTVAPRKVDKYMQHYLISRYKAEGN